MTEERRRDNPYIIDELQKMNSKLDINEKIHQFELELASLSLYMRSDQERYARLIEDQKKFFDKMDRFFFVGDGDKPSFATKVDRLEQSHIRTEVYINWWAGILATIVAGIVLYLIIGKHT